MRVPIPDRPCDDLAIAARSSVWSQSAGAQSAPDRAKVLRAAADALGMARWSDIGANTTRLPAIDVVNTMELYGSGTSDISGGQSKSSITSLWATTLRPCAWK